MVGNGYVDLSQTKIIKSFIEKKITKYPYYLTKKGIIKRYKPLLIKELKIKKWNKL